MNITKKIPINPDLYRAIRRYILDKKLKPDQHLFQKSANTYNRHLKALCKDLGIKPNGFNIRIHSFRHSRCSHLDDINLASFLTNDNVLTIYRIYRDLDFDAAKEKLLAMKNEHTSVPTGGWR